MIYVYLHINETGVFYVGCGGKGRPHGRARRSPHWIKAAQDGYSVEVVGEHETKSQAWEQEKYLIAYFKDTVVNRSIGGPPGLGIEFSDLAREKCRRVNLGKVLSSHTKSLIGLARKGKCQGPDNPFSKLTTDQAISIFKDPRSLGRLAAEYQVSKRTINRVKSGASWGWLNYNGVTI